MLRPARWPPVRRAPNPARLQHTRLQTTTHLHVKFQGQKRPCQQAALGQKFMPKTPAFARLWDLKVTVYGRVGQAVLPVPNSVPILPVPLTLLPPCLALGLSAGIVGASRSYTFPALIFLCASANLSTSCAAAVLFACMPCCPVIGSLTVPPPRRKRLCRGLAALRCTLAWHSFHPPVSMTFQSFHPQAFTVHPRSRPKQSVHPHGRKLES